MTSRRAKTAKLPVEPKPLRPPTEAERRAIEAAASAHARRPVRAKLTIERKANGALSIGPTHSDGGGWAAHLTESFGTRSTDFANRSLTRITNAVVDRDKPIDEHHANAALALLGAIAPATELEAAIGEQIIAAHIASLDFLHRARMNAGEYVNTASTYANMATKTSRTMAAMVETLAKLRTGGQQRIEVVHVHGPAVIGDNAQTVIAAGGGDGSQNVDQPHAPASLARIAAATGLPLRGEDAGRDALPVTGGAEPAAVSDARRD